MPQNTYQMNLPRGVTPISHDIYDLHMAILWICVVIGVIVFGVIIYAIIYHRKSKKHKPVLFHESKRIEIAWTLIPLLILIIMAIPASLVLMRMNDDSKADINIKITGYQWKWKYDYLDQNISFFSNLSTPRDQIEGKSEKEKWYLLNVDNPLVVPIHKKIRFLVTSNDVIHSWWVPALGVKRDAIPGFMHEAWARIDKPGTYRGQCAELCGMHHAYMPIVVIAMTQENFDQWVAGKTQAPIAKKEEIEKPLTKEELMVLGKATYEKNCVVCHKPDGSGMPPAFPTMIGSKIVTGDVKAHIQIVSNGKPSTAMQAFKNQLSKKELAAVITYERNSFGNNDQQKYGKQAGGIVQPSNIK